MEMFRNKELEAEYINLYDEILKQFPVKTEEKYIDSKYCNTHVLRCGNPAGKPLVLLHCMGASSLCWSGNINVLAEKYDVYMIDVIGEPNKTINYTNNVTFSDYMEWLDLVIQSLGLNKILLAGWSYGGFLAIGYAIKYSSKVERVMALSPAGTMSKLTTKFMIKLFPALISGKESKIQDFWVWICSDKTKTPEYKIFCKGMQSFQGWARGTKIKVYTDNELSSLHIPCFILLGDKDPIYTKRAKKDIERINKLSDNINVEFISGTHGFLLQNAEETNEKMISFLG